MQEMSIVFSTSNFKFFKLSYNNSWINNSELKRYMNYDNFTQKESKVCKFLFLYNKIYQLIAFYIIYKILDNFVNFELCQRKKQFLR